MPSEYLNQLKRVMLDNVHLERYKDEHGSYICNLCKCPLIMHQKALGCDVKRLGCKNPDCEYTKTTVAKSNEEFRNTLDKMGWEGSS